MRILITNISLAELGGTQLYVRDLAHGLRRRGHDVAVYSPEPGLALDVPVFDRLDDAPVPDVIHAHHTTVAMEAFLRFPGVPGVFLVHDRRSWHDEPPKFPGILRTAAVDEACLERVPGGRVIPNAVDLDRFRPRGPLPGKPHRALLFASGSAGKRHVRPVTRACRTAGIELDVVGVKNQIDAPEKILGGYDLVFGKARCALEAMAVGAAVVLVSGEGAGPMVTTSEFDRLRALNFGFRTLTRPLHALAGEIAKYDAADATRVAKRVREEASLDGMLDRWIALYEEILREKRPPDLAAEARAAAEYLRGLHRSLLDLQLIRQSQSYRVSRKIMDTPVVGGLLRAARRFLDSGGTRG